LPVSPRLAIPGARGPEPEQANPPDGPFIVRRRVLHDPVVRLRCAYPTISAPRASHAGRECISDSGPHVV